VDQYGNLAVPTVLPPDHWYRVVVQFNDRATHEPRQFVKCLHENSVDTRFWPDVLETRGNVLDFVYAWSVIIVQAPDLQTCESDGGSPLSPRSPTFKFYLR